MRDLGLFLANLRSSAGVSLEILAKVVGSSKSSISRLENGEVPLLLRGSVRALVLCLGEVLCTSQKEVARFLQLAELNPALLTESEKIQLGERPQVTPGASDELSRLKQLEHI